MWAMHAYMHVRMHVIIWRYRFESFIIRAANWFFISVCIKNYYVYLHDYYNFFFVLYDEDSELCLHFDAFWLYRNLGLWFLRLLVERLGNCIINDFFCVTTNSYRIFFISFIHSANFLYFYNFCCCCIFHNFTRHIFVSMRAFNSKIYDARES